MVTIKDYGYNYNVFYNGDKENYHSFFNFMVGISDAKRLTRGRSG